MPRGGRGPASRRKSHGGRRGGPSSLETSSAPFLSTSASQSSHKGLSMLDEARNTERHTYWDSDQKLRHSAINFVSATKVDTFPETSKPPEIPLARMTLDSSASPSNELEIEVLIEEDDSNKYRGATKGPVNDPIKDPVEEPVQFPTFIIDTLGDQTIQTGLQSPRVRSVSQTPSDSSAEVILFSGRNNRGKHRIVQPSTPLTQAIDTKIKVIDEKIHERKELLNEVLHHKDTADFEALSVRGNQARRGRRSNRKTHREEEDALIADYLLNMEHDDEEVDLARNMSFGRRELGATEEEVFPEDEQLSRENVWESKYRTQDGWDPSTMHDFDNMSTSDGAMGDVQAILSKRERDSGLQYLIVWENQTVDEARWVYSTSLTSPSAILQIEKFETEELIAELHKDDEGSGSTDSEDTDDELDEEDEEDLLQRRVDRMTDEQIARLLAKQEELGLDANELLLFDGTADAEDEEAKHISKATYNPFELTPPHFKAKGRTSKRPRGEFPSASALADAYDGFDVMDLDRPSLKKKPIGRRGKLAIDLSDSELEASIQTALTKDRLKKKEKKQQREELRAQGLLGKKNGKPDLKEKYKEGMGFYSIKEEIKTFLMGNNTTLALPPMDKADRKVVHEIANAFDLKSKSAGSGKNRFPILIRTPRTAAYVERTFKAVEARLTRRYLPRMDVGGKKSTPRGSGRVGGGGFNNAAVSYRDGDIVGGSAPELGIENKGRAMLEKMGWSTGTALGAINNKGILQPVSHVVKTGKAGLG